MSGFFPDDYVESPSLFKRKGVYYVTYGSCCCGCAEGGGIVIFTAPSVHGPWTRQVSTRRERRHHSHVSVTRGVCVCVLCGSSRYTPHDGTLIPIGIPPPFLYTPHQTPHSDVNCVNASAPVCGGFGLRSEQKSQLVFGAQWWGPSFIPVAGGGDGDNGDTGDDNVEVVFTGRRWLSGDKHPPGCMDICGNGGHPELCTGTDYFLKSDLSVWYPLEFDKDTGAILPMRPLPEFNLTLPPL